LSHQLTDKPPADWCAIESNSPFASPVHLLRKGGNVRLVMDYRALNAVTIRQLWPTPRIDTILSSFHGACHFMVIDLNAAFHQIAFTTERDSELAAFITTDGNYQRSAVMQALIDRVLSPFKSFALAYMDDIMIFSISFEERCSCTRRASPTLPGHQAFNVSF
jgi:hypothetical protein